MFHIALLATASALSAATPAPTAPSASAAATCDAHRVISQLPRCPALFGDATRREANLAAPAAVHRVTSTDTSVDIVYSGTPQEAPAWARLADVEVVALSAPEALCSEGDAAPVAHVRLRGALADRCGAADVALRTGDAFGADGRVLAITAAGVLLESQDTLSWWLPRDQEEPVIRMSWRSSFMVMTTSKGKSSSRKKSHSSSSRKNKSKKRSRKKSRKK